MGGGGEGVGAEPGRQVRRILHQLRDELITVVAQRMEKRKQIQGMV